jgi:type II secretory pathway pseudopilin PulG
MKLSVKAFTLVELLLAAAILALVISGLLLVFLNCIFLNEANRNSTTAISHAQFAMEEIKNTNFGSIASATWGNSTIVSKGLNPLNNESISIGVSGSTVLNVNVTVNWKDRGTRDRNMSLVTLISEP